MSSLSFSDALRLDLCFLEEEAVVSEARNKRNPPTSVVGGLFSHPDIVRVKHKSMGEKGRLLLPGGTASLIASRFGMSSTLLFDAEIRSRLSPQKKSPDGAFVQDQLM